MLNYRRVVDDLIYRTGLDGQDGDRFFGWSFVLENLETRWPRDAESVLNIRGHLHFAGVAALPVAGCYSFPCFFVQRTRSPSLQY